MQPNQNIKDKADLSHQYSTFWSDNRLYGIDVTSVQEVVKPMKVTPVPLANDYVRGLINLRGQVTTAIGLRELLGLHEAENAELMNVVCKAEGDLISLHVDEIGDVIELNKDNFEPVPSTIPKQISTFMDGVFKMNDTLLSILSIDKISQYLKNTNK